MNPKTNQSRNVLLLFGAVSVFAMILIIVAAFGRESSTRAGTATSTSVAGFDPDISGTSASLTLRNPSSISWRETKLHINDTFECVVGTVGAYLTVVVNTRNCARADGTRFSPLIHKVTKIQTEAIVGNDFAASFKTKRFN